jgi:RHS repeat-associated protein
VIVAGAARALRIVQLTLNSAAQDPQWQQYTPYGAPRGTAPASWPDTNGFLGKPTDPTSGLTIIGARQYDPTTGLFLSIDPILETTSPLQLNGYSYAADNPVTNSDPTGLMPIMISAGGCVGSIQYCEGHPAAVTGGNSGAEPNTGTAHASTGQQVSSGGGKSTPAPARSRGNSNGSGNLRQVCEVDSVVCTPTPVQMNEDTPLQDNGGNWEPNRVACLFTVLGLICPSQATTEPAPDEGGTAAAAEAEDEGIDKLVAALAEEEAEEADSILARDIHGALRQAERDVTWQEVWDNPDSQMYIQTDDGQVVKALDNGNDTFTIVVRDMSNPSGRAYDRHSRLLGPGDFGQSADRILAVSMSEGQTPTRADVENRWMGIVQGRFTRNEVHMWASRWVETGGLRQLRDAMVRNALQHLHGYDLVRNPDHPERIRHAPEGDFIRSLDTVAQELEQWHSDCRAYDADPQGYALAARRRALDALALSDGLRTRPPDEA